MNHFRRMEEDPPETDDMDTPRSDEIFHMVSIIRAAMAADPRV